MQHLYDRYVKAVKREIVELFFSGGTIQLDTVFFGGGTPSVLSAEQIEDILRCCGEYFSIRDGAEISLEVNPRTIDLMKLIKLREIGINRLSIGIQSFIDIELETMGRLHNAQEGWDCIRDALASGFTNISVDLMYGVPFQTAEMWKWNVESALSLGVPHLSLYQLTIEENTPFETRLKRGDFTLPDEEEVLLMDEISLSLCRESGLKQYEISNYSLFGFECEHNINYWQNNEYLGVGAGSVGYIQGERRKNVSVPLNYCEALELGEEHVVSRECLSREESFRETVIMGLRMVKGVSFRDLFDRYGINLSEHYGEILDPLLENGLVEFSDTSFRLTDKGRPIANQILSQLV